MRIVLFILSILLLSCSSKKNHIAKNDYENEAFVLDGFGVASSAGGIDLLLHDKGIPKGILYRIENEKLVYIEAYINGTVCQVVKLDRKGKIKNISKDINETETVAQEININELGNVFYIADNCCRDDSAKNGIEYHVDDSCRLTKLIKFEKGIITNLTYLNGHGGLTEIVFECNDLDTTFINPSDNTKLHFTKEIMKVSFHPTGFYETALIGYTTDEIGIEAAYIPPQKVEFRSEDGYPTYDSDFGFLKLILPEKLEKNAIKMDDSQRSDYVVKMLAAADSAFLKIDDFIVFLNYLLGKRTEEHSEDIGYYIMNIYLNNRAKINRLEEYIAMMPTGNQLELYKGFCSILLYEYANEKTFNDTIDTRELYESFPILERHSTLTKEIAKESGIILVNK